jgi:uncharacterized membrane protein YdcZ (DUF606 family)
MPVWYLVGGIVGVVVIILALVGLDKLGKALDNEYYDDY